MRGYVPTPQDISELNSAAEKLTDKALKSKPLCAITRATTFYKKLSSSNSPDCVESMEGISKKAKVLVKRIEIACGYSTKKPDDFIE